ncbi:MAG TPA: SBBP repeat-containing protein [Pyrinomonadaceae bacterium]|jgi:uncharacterized repeat protein (TIGR01451 family)|nr:SBBP repeat-containing protein [Pyrinomonadaceae bacterium]
MPRIASRRNLAPRKSHLPFFLALLGLAAAAALTLPVTRRADASSPPPARAKAGAAARLLDSYGRLPLRFEANRGQARADVLFTSRGAGYSLMLTRGGAVLNLSRGESTLRFGLVGANRSPKVVGLNVLPSKSNYLIGADRRAWRTGVENYGRVKYEAVYKGVDLVYYGNEGRLEYDFLVAPGADPSRVRLSFEGAREARIDEGGDLVLSADGGEVRLQKPFAYQESDGRRAEVAARYVKDARGAVGFELGEYDRTRPLVIDPVLIYSSYLGGLDTDQGQAVAVDSSGSAYVAGTTASTNFSSANAFQPTKSGFNDAYVLKLSPDGKSLVFATYVGGGGDDFGNALAVDAAGSAYLSGATGSGNFPTTGGAFQMSKDGGLDAFVLKLDPSGSSLAYSTFMGGGGNEQGSGIAADSSGAAYVVGRTDSFTFPRIPMAVRAGNPVQASTDGAATWAASGAGLTAAGVFDFAVAPSAPQTVYAATSSGVFKSTDGGANWHLTGQARTSTAPFSTRSVVVDPTNPSVVYAATGGGAGIYKSTDGGGLYETKGSGLITPSVNSLAIDPSTPTTLYAATLLGVFKTTNGGDTWAQAAGNLPGSTPNVNEVVVDPTAPQTVYAATTNRGVLKSTDGGANWTLANNGLTPTGFINPTVRTLVLAPSQPSTLYAAVTNPTAAVYKSTDGGANWTLANNGLSFISFNGQVNPLGPASLLVDPASPSTVYAGTSGFGVYKTTDGGASWAPSNTGLTSKSILALAWRPGSPAALLAGAAVGNDAFALKLNPAGTFPEYVRLLGGAENDDARAVALGPGGTAYLTGLTSSSDFPTASPFQPARGGFGDAYVVKLDAGGATAFATYLGGSSSDQGAGIGVGPDGAVYVAGTTGSTNFPLANALQNTIGDIGGGDAFVTKLAADGQSLLYSTYLGGEGFEQGLGLAVGADGSAHVTGTTSSENFPAVNPVAPFGGFSDAFVIKLNPAGSSVLFSTYLGGANTEQGNGIAIDAAGGIYVAGTTTSTNFPVGNALRPTYGGGNSDAFVAKFGPGVDLELTIADSPDPVALGADLTYTIGVRNRGDLPATGVTLTDVLPAGMTFVSATTSKGSCSGTTTVVCDLGTVGGGELVTVTVVVKPPAVRLFINGVSVNLNETDADPSNNVASAATTVDFADIALTKSVLFGTAAPGSKVVFMLTATNKGGTTAAPVTITDTLPDGLTFASCDAPRGTCGGTGNNRTVTFNSVAVGSTESAVVFATLSPSAAAGTVFTNTAAVAATPGDPDTSNNTASASFTVGAVGPTPKSNGKIAFMNWEAPTTRLMVVNPDGTGLAGFTPGQESDRLPDWSPDGSKLAYRTTTHTGSPGNPENVVVVNADGTGKTTVATDAAFDAKPTWSPTGDSIAYVGFVPFVGTFSVNVVRADGTAAPSRLVANTGPISGLEWSPDGSRFAFVRNGALFVMDIDGANQRQLTTPPVTSDGQSSDSDPDWSPDGSKILFTRSTINGSNALVINADGTGLVRAANIDQMSNAAWSPDGSKVVYTLGNDIYVANLDGSGLPFRVAPNGRTPAWQPLANANPTPTPAPAQTFTLSGRVKNPDGTGLSALVRLSGTRTASIGTDADGNYTFVNLPRGGTYTVTPSSNLSNFTVFEPGSRTASDLQDNVTGFDFVGTNVTHKISGRVTNLLGQPLAGVTVSLTRGGTQTTTTDADGRYSFNIVNGFGQFNLQLFLSGYSFDGGRGVLRDLTGDAVVNFVGTPFSNARGIGGRVVDAEGNPVAGLTVTLGGARSAADRTDANGAFVFANLPTGQTYTVTPSTASGLAFSPAQRVFDNLTLDQFVGFTATTAQAVAQFASAETSVAENARFVELTVRRAGDVSAAASIEYETADLTASERSDYIAAFGTVRFERFQFDATFRVLITDDNLVEGERLFRVTLKNGRNLRPGSALTTTVRITEDDAAASPANPIDSAQFFVTQHYADFLNRVPDDSGLAHWTNVADNCGDPDRLVCRINVSAAFFLAIEFQETGFLVYRAHTAAFGTGRELRHKTFLKDTQQIARGVIVNQGEWRAQLDANKEEFMNDFVLRPEFLNAYPATLAPALFVDQLNANTGGVLTQGERDSLVAALSSGAASRASVLRAVAENEEFTRREKNKAFVLVEYFGYLRRGPSEPPDSDFSGYDFWLGNLNHFNGNFIHAEMVKAFITSTEYRKRFGQ